MGVEQDIAFLVCDCDYDVNVEYFLFDFRINYRIHYDTISKKISVRTQFQKCVCYVSGNSELASYLLVRPLQPAPR